VEAYTSFAAVYDELMDDTPYEAWKKDIVSLFRAEGISEGLVLDLGCGTGTMTMLLAEEGYDMIGADLSMEMLEIARQKKEGTEYDILYLCQDMREFELYGTVAAVVCVCDSLNYLLELSEVEETFRLVNNYLDPGGIFIFDFNTVYKYREIIGDAVIAENRDKCSFIWENYYEEETGINEYALTIFVEEKEGLFRKFEEQHLQKGYELEEIKECLLRSGMEFVKAYDTETGKEPCGQTERITVVAREQGKKKEL